MSKKSKWYLFKGAFETSYKYSSDQLFCAAIKYEHGYNGFPKDQKKALYLYKAVAGRKEGCLNEATQSETWAFTASGYQPSSMDKDNDALLKEELDKWNAEWVKSLMKQ
jgi:hypothetical protein